MIHFTGSFVKEFTIYGEPASKANSRIAIPNRKRFIKSEKALNYLETFHIQCPELISLLDGDLGVVITIYYMSRRPDLDESLILDAMQGKIYGNDRQVKEKLIRWGLDKNQPRAEIGVYRLHEES